MGGCFRFVYNGSKRFGLSREEEGGDYAIDPSCQTHHLVG